MIKDNKLPPEETSALEEYADLYILNDSYDCGVLPEVPLGTEDLLCNPLLPFPTCFIYGDADWMCFEEETWGQHVVNLGQQKFKRASRLVIVPNAGHFGWFDNPYAYANAIINCLLDENLPILSI